MNEIKLNNLILEEYCGSNDTAWLYLHGFPGPGKFNSPLPNPSYVVDVIKEIIYPRGDNFYFLYYGGMAKSAGEFSFLQTIYDGKSATEYLISKYKKINIIARSWGTVVGLNVLSEFKESIDKFIMITPYCAFPPKEHMREMILQFAGNYPWILQTERVEDYLLGIGKIVNDYLPITRVRENFGKKVAIISAVRDEVIPINLVREFAREWGSHVFYYELDDHHALENIIAFKDVLNDFI